VYVCGRQKSSGCRDVARGRLRRSVEAPLNVTLRVPPLPRVRGRGAPIVDAATPLPQGGVSHVESSPPPSPLATPPPSRGRRAENSARSLPSRGRVLSEARRVGCRTA